MYCVLRSACMQMQKSRQLGQNYISPEHIVLALFTNGDSGVKAVIERYTPCSFPQPAMLVRQLSGAHMPQHQWPLSDSVACDASSVSWLAESLGSSFTTKSFDTNLQIPYLAFAGWASPWRGHHREWREYGMH